MQTLRNMALMLCCLLATVASAQRTVTGIVTDQNNESIVGATVSLKENNTIGTATDADGKYKLTLPDNGEYTLQVSYLGYASSTKKLNSNEKGEVNFTLQEDVIYTVTIVVTGTRTPKLLKDAPIVTRVITADEIRKTDATNVSDLLQSELPGFEMSYTMGQQASINLSGFGGNSVLFLVDGERLAGETMNNVDYSRLNLDNVERIEIVKGAASSLYGSNAVGGVINLISKDSSEPWTLNVNGHYGAHHSQRYGATATFNAGKFSSVTNVQYTYVSTIGLENEDESSAAYSAIYGGKTWNVKERLMFSATDKLKLTARAGYFFRERFSSAATPERYRDFSGGLKGNYNFSQSNDLELAYTFDQYDKSDYVVSSGKDIRDYSNVQHSVRGLYNHTLFDDYTLTVGGDFMRDYLMTYQFKDNGSYRQYTGDGFLQLDMNFTDRFNVIAGLRYDYYSKADASHLSSKIGLMYKVSNCSLRGSYSGGFRAPTLKEMYMEFDMASVFMIYGNEDLKPEVSHNFSLSAEYIKSRYNLTITGFYNLVDDRITNIWNTSLGGMEYANISRVRVTGVDANASMRLPCGFGGRISYAYTHEHFKSDALVSRNTRPHTATARLEYGKNLSKNYSFNLALTGRFLSEVDAQEVSSSDEGVYDSLTDVTYDAYTIWKLTLSQNVWKGILLTMAVDNLFDYKPDTYYSNSPYTTGATFSASVSFDIDKFFK